MSCSKGPTGAAVCLTGNDCGLTDEDYIKIPVSEVTNTMKKLSFDADGVNVDYFVVKGSGGDARTAFYACDVCGGYKGYSQRGNDVVCNNCGRVFNIDDIGTKNGPGGCWPSYLSYKIEDGNVLIKKSELAKGAFRFA